MLAPYDPAGVPAVSKFTDASGNPIYTTTFTVTPASQTFEYTIKFNSDVADAKAMADIVAHCDGYRVLTWEVTDAAANRQGLTIAGKLALCTCPTHQVLEQCQRLRTDPAIRMWYGHVRNGLCPLLHSIAYYH